MTLWDKTIEKLTAFFDENLKNPYYISLFSVVRDGVYVGKNFQLNLN